MKIRIISLLVLVALCIVPPVMTQTTGEKELTFQWEQPLPPEDLAGWYLYYGTAPGVYNRTAVFNYSGAPSAVYTQDFTLTSPTGQTVTYYFVLTAFDSSGNESGFSNEVMAKVDFLAPGVPVNLRVTIKVQ